MFNYDLGLGSSYAFLDLVNVPRKGICDISFLALFFFLPPIITCDLALVTVGGTGYLRRC